MLQRALLMFERDADIMLMLLLRAMPSLFRCHIQRC